MSYVSFPVAPNTQYDKDSFQAPPETPLSVGTITSFENGLNSLPVTGVFAAADKSFLRNTQPGNFLSNDQIQQKYPEMADKYPKGGQESDVKFDSARRQKEDFQDSLMTNMKPGFVSSVGRIAGSNLSFLADPTTFGVGAVAEKLGGVIGSKVISGIMKSDLAENQVKNAALAAKAGIGFGKGVSIGIPLAISTKDYYHSINLTYSPMNTALTLGMFGLGDAALTTVIGFKSPIDPQDSKFISQKAMQDMGKGKSPDVEPSLKQALYSAQQKDLENAISPDEQGKVLQAVSNIHDESKTSLNTAQKDMDSYLSEHPEVAEKIQKDIPSSQSILEHMRKLKSVPEENYSEDDKSFMNNLPNNDETKEAANYEMMNPEDLNPDQKDFLDKYKSGQESDLIQKGIEDNKNEIEKANQRIKELKDAPNKDEENFNRMKVSALEDELDRKNARLDDLKTLENLPAKFKKLKDEVDTQNARVNYYKNMLEDTGQYFNLRNMHDLGVTKDDLVSSVNRDRSPQSNFDYSGKVPGIDEEAKDLSDEEVGALNDEINNYVEANGDKANEIKDALKDMSDDQDKNDGIKKALKAYVDCNNRVT